MGQASVAWRDSPTVPSPSAATVKGYSIPQAPGPAMAARRDM
jgi:hypothetical protein